MPPNNGLAASVRRAYSLTAASANLRGFARKRRALSSCSRSTTVFAGRSFTLRTMNCYAMSPTLIEKPRRRRRGERFLPLAFHNRRPSVGTRAGVNPCDALVRGGGPVKARLWARVIASPEAAISMTRQASPGSRREPGRGLLENALNACWENGDAGLKPYRMRKQQRDFRRRSSGSPCKARTTTIFRAALIRSWATPVDASMTISPRQRLSFGGLEQPVDRFNEAVAWRDLVQAKMPSKWVRTIAATCVVGATLERMTSVHYRARIAETMLICAWSRVLLARSPAQTFAGSIAPVLDTPRLIADRTARSPVPWRRGFGYLRLVSAAARAWVDWPPFSMQLRGNS